MRVSFALALLLLPLPAIAADWHDVSTPSPGTAQVVGSYANGCVGGAVALPLDAPGFSVLRPQRNRFWGHPDARTFVEAFAAASPTPVLIGDVSQPRGGPMPSGHGSHQAGLDIDIWFKPAPPVLSDAERAEPQELSVVAPGGKSVDPSRFTNREAGMVERAARFPQVERIFVNPAIKKALCERTGADRAWLRKVRPWFGHDAHMHVRLSCPADSPDCQPQTTMPEGDGCGAELDSWFAPPKEKVAPPVKKEKKTLPLACSAILSANK